MPENRKNPDSGATVRLNREDALDSEVPSVHKHLGEFEVLSELGRGGMGIVYKAHQRSLDRCVALKVLPSAFGMSHEATERFEREARAAARLRHKNIVSVHAIGEDRGQHFYAMELVDGVSLDKVVTDLSKGIWHESLNGVLTDERSEVDPAVLREQFQSGDRAWSEVVASLIAEVAEGLEYAHSQGVVHRDIKPANLMLSSQGQVLITDFGLARLSQEPGLTRTGALVGTPAYMSPEQVSAGNMPLDHRTDIYSLGAVLYEMLTLQRPFAGKSPEDVIGEVLTKDPVMLRRIKPAIPHDLETICLHAMEKDPKQRYQTAEEMARDLREFLRDGMIQARPMSPAKRMRRSLRRRPMATTTVFAAAVIATLVALNWDRVRQIAVEPSSLNIQRLAVLPFSNTSGDPDQEIYADGMTEVLIADLGHLEGLEVVAKRTVMQYKNSSKSIQDIARDLHVDALVEGSVLGSPEGRIRVTATLVDAKTEGQIWGDRYERSLTDILMLQGEVARGIANQIRVELTPDEEAYMTVDRVVNPAAHEAYLIGKSFVGRWTQEDVDKGIRYLETALQQDPDYAPALAGYATACVYSVSICGGWNAPGEVVEKARTAANRALEIDDSLAEPHAALAIIDAMFDMDAKGAERELQRAIELDPNFADARAYYSFLLRMQGPERYPEAFDQLQLAIQTDPLNPFYRMYLMWLYLVMGKPTEVSEEFDTMADLNPPPVVEAEALLAMAFVAKGQGRTDDFIALLERSVEVTDRQHPDVLKFLAQAYEAVGRHSEAMGILEELQAMAKRRYVSPTLMAELYAQMGDADTAFGLLEQAYQNHCRYLVFLDGICPSLHADPRWADLLERVGTDRLKL